MASCLISVTNVVILLCSSAIMVTFLSPTGFEAVYVRETNEEAKFNETNLNSRVKSMNDDEWPTKMKLQFPSFFCSTPDPNFELAENELNEIWRVPQRSRLSKSMKEIGRCKMAAKWKYFNGGGYGFDSRKCNCVDAWWAIVIFTVAAMSSVRQILAFFVGNGQRRGGTETDERQLRNDRCFTVFWAIIWYVTLSIYALRNADIGLTYQPYGDMYPKPYFSHEPIHWFIVFLLITTNCTMEFVKFVNYSMRIQKPRRQSIASLANVITTTTRQQINQSQPQPQPPPPSYESLRFNSKRGKNKKSASV